MSSTYPEEPPPPPPPPTPPPPLRVKTGKGKGQEEGRKTDCFNGSNPLSISQSALAHKKWQPGLKLVTCAQFIIKIIIIIIYRNKARPGSISYTTGEIIHIITFVAQFIRVSYNYSKPSLPIILWARRRGRLIHANQPTVTLCS